MAGEVERVGGERKDLRDGFVRGKDKDRWASTAQHSQEPDVKGREDMGGEW